MNNVGHILLHRKVRSNPVWNQLSPAAWKVFCQMLMEANYKQSVFHDGLSEVTVPAGSFVTSYQSIANACHLSLQQVRDAFTHIERLGIAKYERTQFGTQGRTETRTPRYTIVSLSNWRRYQPENLGGTESRTQIGTQIGTPSEEIKNLNKKPLAASPKNWPLSAAAVRGHFPATDSTIEQIIVKCLFEFATLSDEDLADAVHEARKRKPKQRTCGLFVETVPEVVREWAAQATAAGIS